MAISLLPPSAVSATATGRATRTAASPDRKSAKPNGLLKPACIAWAGDALIDTASASPDERDDCITAPWACLSNMMTRFGLKSGCNDCSASRLVHAQPSESVLKKPQP